MAEKKTEPTDMVKKQTLWIIAAICLAVGFFSGVLLTIYKTGDPMPVASVTAPPSDNQLSAQRQEMIQMLEKETSKNPDNKEAWIALGNNYFDTGKNAKAVVAYEKALKLDPGNANVWTDLGVMYRRTDQPKKAVEAFDRAVKVDPNHQTARYNKGIVLMHDLNDQKGAIRAWEDLIKINPSAKTPNGSALKDIIQSFKNQRPQ